MHKYVFDLTLAGRPQKVILGLAAGESSQHVIMKLLALVLHFERQPKVEFSVRQHYKPDLVCQDGRDVTLWIECGDVSIHKLDRVSTTNRRAEIIVVKPNLRTASAYKRQAEKRVRRPERIRYLTFDDGFVDKLAGLLPSRAALAIDLAGARLEVRHAGQTLTSQVQWLADG